MNKKKCRPKITERTFGHYKINYNFSSECHVHFFITKSSKVGILKSLEYFSNQWTQFVFFSRESLRKCVMLIFITAPIQNFKSLCVNRYPFQILIIIILHLPTNMFMSITPSNENLVNGAAFCTDAFGLRRGVFSTWKDAFGCRCSCNPVGNMAVSVCDEVCEGLARNLSLNRDPLNEFDSSRNSTEYACFYPENGHTYDSNHVWMSMGGPCEKCRCLNGTIDCMNSVLHCATKCYPGQTTIITGPCCEHDCIGDALSGTENNLHCRDILNNKTYNNGDTIKIENECVDQKCQCIHGNWSCFDFCSPRDALTCQFDDQIFWDKFCCPRCKGKNVCTTHTTKSNSGEKGLETSNAEEFFSILTPAVQTSEEDEYTSERSTNLKRAESLPSVELESVTPDVGFITIDPGHEVLTFSGRCVCTDGRMRCSRKSDAGIWHETDCYYSEHGKDFYYSEGDRWRPKDDACIECECFRGNTYTCTRNPCRSLFICPPGNLAVARPGDCCPSLCRKVKPHIQANQIGRNHSLEKKYIPESAEFEHIPTVDTVGKCKSLGPRLVETTSNVLLPTETVLIIKRACIDLRCECAPTGKWICADYCNPCANSLGTIDDNTTEVETKTIRLNESGCCNYCDRTERYAPQNGMQDSQVDMSSTHALDRYTRSITILLICVTLIPLTTIILCCAYFRIKAVLKRRRSKQSKLGNRYEEHQLILKRQSRNKNPFKVLAHVFQQTHSSSKHSGSQSAQSKDQLIGHGINSEKTVEKHAEIKMTYVNADAEITDSQVTIANETRDILPVVNSTSSRKNCGELIQIPGMHESNKLVFLKRSDQKINSLQSAVWTNERFGSIGNHFFVHLPPARQKTMSKETATKTAFSREISGTIDNDELIISISNREPPPKPSFPGQIFDAKTSF